MRKLKSKSLFPPINSISLKTLAVEPKEFEVSLKPKLIHKKYELNEK
jgi:hypothetical protein